MDLSRVSFARSLERKRGIYTEQIYEIIIFCFRWFDCLYTGCLFFFQNGQYLQRGQFRKCLHQLNQLARGNSHESKRPYCQVYTHYFPDDTGCSIVCL